MSKEKWNDEFFVKSYQLARSGLTNGQIASHFGVTMGEMRKWVEDRPALELAIKEGRNRKSGPTNFIFGKLSEKAQACWRRVMKAEKETNSVRKIELLFGHYGEGIKKELFLHCLAGSHFNPSKACRKVGIPYREYQGWINNDYEFAQLIIEMGEHRGNFYDEKFNELVEEKEPSVVVWAQKTYNRNRGFGDKVEIKHSGEIKSTNVMELGDKFYELLSTSAKREVLAVMQQLQIEQKQEMNTVNALN